MHSRLGYYLRANNILFPEQFNFRKGISTKNVAFKLTDSILKSLNQKVHVGRIFYHLAKAFDCVNHEVLLTKLHNFVSRHPVTRFSITFFIIQSFM
jgi:hypothetical protein